MIDPFLAAGIILGLVILITNLVTRWRFRVAVPPLNECVLLVLSGVGVVSGFRFGIVSFRPPFEISGWDQVYFVVGGISVIYVSMKQVRKSWGRVWPFG